MVRLNLFCLCLIFCRALDLSGQNYNRPVPAQMRPFEFIQHDSTLNGYYLTTPFSFGPGASNQPLSLQILDPDGYLFWYMQVDARNVADFKYHPLHKVYTFIKFLNPQIAYFMLMDTNLEVIDSFSTVNGILPDAHDFQITKDRTFLLAGASDSIMDMSAYLFNGMPGSPNTHALGFVVQEFDEDHNLLNEWDSNDHIHPTAAYPFYGYSAAKFDYCHGNTIEEDSDGNLLLCFRHLNAIYKIDRHNGKILWQLGGKTSSFTFQNDPGFSGQHDVRRLPNGNISIYDNANMSAPPRISRAVEYALDTLAWTATKVWEYKYVPGFFSPAMGNHQTTPVRQHLVHYGLNYRPKPSFVRTDNAGNLLSELNFADSVMSYRSYLFDLPVDNIQRPAVTCSQNNGIITLFAPQGYERYEWSTGETAASIAIQAPGTYQVWVNHGKGMLGSEPYFIQDLTQACPVSSVGTDSDVENQTIIGYYDLLGRAIAPPQHPGSGTQIYMVQYANGRLKLMMQ